MATLMKRMGRSGMEAAMKCYSLGEDESRRAMPAVPFGSMAGKSASHDSFSTLWTLHLWWRTRRGFTDPE
jgi:hypothetical protein